MSHDIIFTSSGVSSLNVVVSLANVDANCTYARSLPTLRHGSQSYFWTPEWQQRERLADYDLLIGGYQPKDVDDLIGHLHEAAGSAQAH